MGVTLEVEALALVIQEDEQEGDLLLLLQEARSYKYNCLMLQGKQQLFQSAHVVTALEEQSESRSSVSEEQIKE